MKYKTKLVTENFISGETISFSYDEKPVINNLTIYGNMEQNGTPAPTNPVEIKTIKDLSIKINDEGKVINLQHNEFAKIGDVKDELNIDGNGNVTLIKRIGKVVLNGSENWTKWDGSLVNNTILFSTSFNLPNYSNSYITSHFTTNTASFSTNIIGSYIYNNSIRVRIDDLIATDVETFKTWLSNNNVTVYYQLTEEQIINLGNIDIKLVKGYNNLTLDSELSTNMILNYGTNDIKYTLLDSQTAILTKIIVKEQAVDDKEPLPEIILTEDDAVKTWDYEDDRYVPDTGFIGQFVARTLNGELQNITDDFNIEDREIQVCFGIKDFLKETNEIDWYTLGSFFVQKPEDDEVNDNTKFEAMDYTIKFNKDFDANYTSTNFPTSFNDAIAQKENFNAKQLAQYTCEQVGVVFANNHFINDDFIIPNNQFVSGDSCRDVMKNISQLAFGWVRIGWDDKCYIDTLETNKNEIPSYNEIDNDHYYSLTTQKKTYGPVDRVTVGMENINGEALYIPRDGVDPTTTLYVYDNPITYTNDLRNEIIDGGDYLLGMSYVPFEMETPGHIWLLGRDLVKIIDMEGNEKISYPFNVSVKYTGHIKTKLNAPAPTNVEETMGYAADLYKTLKNVKLTVDKQEGTIKAINEKTTATVDGFEKFTERVESIMTSTYTKTQIQDIVSGIGVDGVVVESVQSTAGTFDKDGLTIEQSGSETKTNINSDGMIIYNATGSTDTPMLTVDHTGVVADNIRVSTYTTLGSHSRFEDYTHTDGTQGTGVFWIGR